MKTSLRMMLISSVLCLGLGAGAASATNVTIVPPIDPTGQFSNVHHAAGLFSDDISINITSWLNTSWSVVELPNPLSTGTVYQIDPVNAQLYSGALGDFSTPIGSLISQTSPGSAFGDTQLLSGSGLYHVAVNGDAIGSSGGNYIFSVSAVPEPQTYAMIMVGLGLIGFTLNRRKGQA